jgi:peptidyl-prolyl cis-trans isomerase SurA
MPKFKLYVFLFSFAILFSCKPAKVVRSYPSPTIAKPAAELVIFSLGTEKLHESQIQVTLDNYVVADSLPFEEIVNEILYQKRLFKEATSKGYTMDSILLEEVNSYLSIVAESFLEDTSILNNLVRITYERMHKELNASHILIPVSLYASPSDTLKAFNEVLAIKEAIDNGSPFDSLALVYSGDINTKTLGGEMGWFSALQFLYSLEDVAYRTSVGNVSNPIRTKAGYHILKVNSSRAFSGTASVQHILKSIPNGSSDEFDKFQHVIIDSLYNLIGKGASFEEVCRNNSDDTYTKVNNGLLTPFTIGSRQEKSFEETAFELKPREISKPVKSHIGWHIIKLIEKKPLGSFEALKGLITDKVKTDSRGEYLKASYLSKYNSQLNIKEDKSNLEGLFSLGTKAIESRSWKYDVNKLLERKILEIGNNSYTNKQFLKYALDKQGFEKLFPNYTPDMYLRQYYHDFKNEKIREGLMKNLPDWNPQFRIMADGYKESLVNSQFLNDILYTRSLSDTLGQKNYYKKHVTEYQLTKKAKASLIKANSVNTIEKYAEIIDGEKPYRLKRGIRPISYYKNSANLDDELKKKLIGLTIILENNPNYIVEVGGHRDVNEEMSISYARIDAIVNFLKANGVNITRIREYDYGTSKLVDRFDWTQNQRASFQFFTTNKLDVIKALNTTENPISLTEGVFALGENVFIDGTRWEPGSYEAEFDSQYYRIEIEEVLPARNKSFKEAYGAVLVGFQKELALQLKQDLIVKYPASVNIEEFKKLYAKYKQKNP